MMPLEYLQRDKSKDELYEKIWNKELELAKAYITGSAVTVAPTLSTPSVSQATLNMSNTEILTYAMMVKGLTNENGTNVMNTIRGHFPVSDPFSHILINAYHSPSTRRRALLIHAFDLPPLRCSSSTNRSIKLGHAKSIMLRIHSLSP
jgi:hypothetical protein